VIDTYLWNHEPMLSSAPEEVVKHFLHTDGDEVFECAVMKLENGKFLYIAFSSEFKNESEVGVTDIEEFDNENDAVKLYNESVG
jgi:hypothetical protein